MIQKHFKVLSKDLLTYGMMGVVSRSVGLLLLPVFTRILSVGEYGTIDIIATFTGLVSTSFVLSTPSSLTRYYHDRRASVDSQYITLMLFVLSVCIVGFLIVFGFRTRIALLISNDSTICSYVVLGAASGCVGALNRLPDSLLRMQKKIVSYNVINICDTVTYAGGALFAVIVLKSGLMGVFLSQLFGYSLHLLIGLYLTRPFLRGPFSVAFLRQALKFSIPMFPAVFVTWANQQVSRIILLTTLGVAGVGLFGAAARISALVVLLVTVFQQSWGPFSMEMINHHERNDVYERSLQYYAGIFAILGITLTALSPNVVSLLLPLQYYRAYVMIPWLVGASVVHGAGNIACLGSSISEKTLINSVASWSGLAVNVLLSVILIRHFGIVGAAIGTFSAELVYIALLWRNTAKYSNLRFDASGIIKTLVVYCLVSAGVIVAEHVLAHQPIWSLVTRVVLAAIAIYFVSRIAIDTMLKDGVKRTIAIIMRKLGWCFPESA